MHSKGTPRAVPVRLFTQSTKALEQLRHSALKGHSGTRALEALGYSKGTWALETFAALYLADSYGEAEEFIVFMYLFTTYI